MTDIGETIFNIFDALMYSLFWPINQVVPEIHTLLVRFYCSLSAFSQSINTQCTPLDPRPSIADDSILFISMAIWLILLIIYIGGILVVSYDVIKRGFRPKKRIIDIVTYIYFVIVGMFFVDSYFFDEINSFVWNGILSITVSVVVFFGAHKIVRYLRQRKKE